MTDSRMRTVRAVPVFACAIGLAALLMGCCVALGYHLAQSGARPAVGQALGFRSFDFKRPEGRALVDHVGALSGRLTRLEIEAAELAKRLGISPAATAAPPAPQKHAKGALPGGPAAEPRGGPLLPVSGESALTDAAATDSVGDYGIGLSHLEAEIDVLEASIERMAGIVAERDLTTMAYPNRPPVHGSLRKVSSGFGVRHDPFTGRLARHMGLDIPAAHGTAILASGGGRVRSAGLRGPYGKAIVIDHGDGLQTLYGHCSKLYVRTGELVMPQQKIAAVGSTGRSTGPHLHFEVIRNGVRVEPGRVLASVLPRKSD
jgi:murein DD-endopeptidase MepM/ murein hydrolase activator NlpD